MKLNRIISTLVVFSLATTIAGCSTGLKDVYSPEELRVVLKEAGGWVPLVIPDSKYRTGSIIFVNGTDGQPRWIDHLDSCINKNDFDSLLEVGNIPEVKFSKDASFDASVLLNYGGITAGPGFSRVNNVRLAVDNHSAIAIRLIKFRNWYENLEDENYIEDIDPCLDALERPNTYLVTEAFVITDATYNLYTETGTEVELKTPELGELLKFEPKVAYSVSTHGGLTVNQPVVLAIRQAVRVDSGFQSLAAPGGNDTRSGDALLEKWYMDSNE